LREVDCIIAKGPLQDKEQKVDGVYQNVNNGIIFSCEQTLIEDGPQRLGQNPSY